MSDEIAQLVQVEMEGFKFVVKGGVEVAQFVLRALRSLINYGKDKKEDISDKLLNKPGEKKNLAEILSISKSAGGVPQPLNVRSVDLEEVIRIGTEKGLHFCRVVDFISNDGLTPLMVPCQEVAAWGQIYKAVAEKRLSVDKAIVNSYDQAMDEVREQIHSSSGNTKELEVQFENLMQAREEADKWVKYGEDIQKLSDDKVCYDFNEYLAQSKGTDFEKNPELAMAEYEKGVELGAKFFCKDCFQPVRDKSLMPDSSFMFYIPDSGVMVTREFKLDDKTGIVYSDYSFKSPNGEMFSYSDHNLTKKDWNDSVLPEFMTNAGILEGTMSRSFDNKEKLDLYLQYHNKVANPAKERIEKKLMEGSDVFSNAEAKADVLEAVSELDKGIASASTKQSIEVVCSPDKFLMRDGKLTLKLSDDEMLQFSSVQNVADIAGHNSFRLKISEADNPTLVKLDGDKKNSIPISLNEAKAKMDEVFSSGAKIISESSNIIRNSR